MKKMLFAVPIALLMGACAGEAVEQEIPTNENPAPTVETEIQEPENEVVTDRSAQSTFVESILGEWTCDAATAGVQIDINIKEDGSIYQKIGTQEKTQRYVALDGDRMQILNKKGETFQTWEVKNITEKSMDICWNPDSSKPKTIPYQRK